MSKPSATEFRNLIRGVISINVRTEGGTVCGVNDAAEAILATPEMEQICYLIGLLMEETPLGCPYLLQNGEEGNYGPNTCNSGCYDEPECVTSGWPKLMDRVVGWAKSDDVYESEGN